ncbi:zinc transporter ZIP3 isoform X1 [Cataglyphis hispanica]|uniref:zinc transporter ZIP3 isoform X1 n=1 Tax=Cataglyphis hispanica TaxID=1086592 RepID=UPI0021806431|nr:zinc transporter ZIP3 isoform X1 [Cataglyphis hispanica]XP_050459044.1 zinc transporter ZIP3 isoform X1 [Cataglyphis hispanica]
MFSNTVQAKLASMVLIGAGSFFIGIAPACFISSAQRLQRKLLLSCALCFGAGVLLATSTLHVLPEVRKGLPDYAELVFSCGFLVLYLVEEGVHYFCRSGDHVVEMDHSRHRNTNKRGSLDCRNHSHGVGYNAATQDSKVYVSESDVRLPFNYRQSSFDNHNINTRTFSGYGATRCHAHDGPSSSEETTFLCHGNHGEQCTDANTGLAGLALALTVHAVLEGLAIGLQTQIAEVLLLTGAVASHKYVVGFCLGLELTGVSKSVPKLIFAIFVFAIGSVIGIGIGMLTFQADTDWSKVVLPILQGLAGGTLLYVTVSEVLPRERAKWHKSSRRFAGILQFFSVFVGFVVIFLLNNYVGE